jgi:hypothetical protein
MMRRLACLMIALALAACGTTAAPPPNTGAIPAAPRRGEPGQYLNLGGVALQTAFGKPAFVRRDGATEMWRYDGQSCRAFFFLYGSPLAVRHVETLPHAKNQAADMGCLTALRASPPKTS